MRLSMKTLVAGIMLFSMSCCLFGQEPSNEEAGVKPFGSYSGGSVESVNNENGQLVVNIPFYSLPQRGRLKLDFVLTYQNVGFQGVQVCPPGGVVNGPCDTDYRPLNTKWGVYPATDWPVGVTENSIATGATNGSNSYYATTYTLKEANGTAHDLAFSGGENYHAFDGSGWMYIDSATTPPYYPLSSEGPVVASAYGTVIDTEGNRYNLTSSGTTKVTDVDGNYMTASGSSIVDSMNRTIPMPPSAAAATQGATAGCPAIAAPYQTLTSSTSWTAPGYNGNVSYLFCYATINISTGVSDPPLINQYHLTTTVLQSIVRPDGTYWGFVYAGANPNDSTSTGYGDLVQIIFPTGGSANYTWGGSSLCTPSTVTSPEWYDGVSARELTANGSNSTWSYAYQSVLNNSSGYTTTVTDPLGNQTVHTFTDVSGSREACYLYETGTAYNQETSTGSQINLKTVTTQYQAVAAPNYQQAVAALPTKITTTLPSGLSYTTFSYDSGIVYSEYQCWYDGSWACIGGASSTPTTFGKVTSQTSYDFSGNEISQTQTSYLWQTNSSYITANLLSTPSSVTVYGASGQLAQTTFTYDEGSKVRLTPSPAIATQIGAAPSSVYGHVTTTAHWLNGGTNSSTSTYWLNTGEIDHSVDPKGNTTKYAYSSTYDGTYLTQTTNALGQSSSATYDFNTGLTASTIDPNSETTNYSYDAMNRLTAANYPDGGQTTNAYDPAGYPINSVLSNTLMCNGSPNCAPEPNGQTKSELSVYDGLGRLTETELLSDPAGTDLTITSYDLLGRVQSVTNPYRKTSDATYGVTSYAYDALGREVKQTNAGGSTEEWCYDGTSVFSGQENCVSHIGSGAGSWVDFTEENGKHAQRTSDALGRLVSVIEEANTNKLETDYQYDGLNNLLRVDQWGGAYGHAGDRIRTFAYDSLSRLMDACNPETIATGSTCSASGPWGAAYSYDANGNALTKTDARGVITTYSYDALNRMLSKSFSDGVTPGVVYTYDSFTGWGQTRTNAIGRLVRAYTCGTNMSISGGSCEDDTYSYDPMGRINHIEGATPSEVGHAAFWMPVSYDLAGNLIGILYPDGRVLQENWNSANQLSQVKFTVWSTPYGSPTPYGATGTNVNYSYLSSATYWPDGSPETMTLGNGVTETFSRNRRRQLVETSAALGGTKLFDKQYCYGPTTDPASPFCTVSAGFDSGIIDYVLDPLNSANSQTFTYDGLNRLASFTNGGGSMQQTYTIDPWGNLSQSGTLSSVVSYNTNNRITTSGYGYDAASNLTSFYNGMSTVNYTYDPDGHLLTAANGSAKYFYDGSGERVRDDLGSSNWTEYTYLNGQPIEEVNSNGTWTDYIFANGERLAMASSVNATSPSTTTDYYTADQIGSGRIITNGSGAVISSYTYYPFGQGPQPDENHYLFTGKERDSESGLDNFDFRYYASTMGRFMSPDSGDGGDSNPSDPQSWNLYSYVQNNPLTNTDPDGHDCVTQTRTSDTTESVSVSSGTCSGNVGDGQTQTYVPGTVTGISVNGGNSIDIGYNSYDGSSSGVTNAGAAPIPNNPGLAYGWGNNAQGYQTLGAANKAVNYATAGAVALYGGAAFAPQIAAGGSALLATGRALYYAAAGLLPAVPSAVEKLQKLGISLSEANEIIENPSTQRFVDGANNGNVNYFLGQGGKIIRITTDPNGQRIISAGIVQARNIANGIATGRFTK